MTTQLSNLDIKQLMPPSIVTDEVVAALCDAFQIELDQIVAEIINILFLPRVDQLSGDILEHLAWGLNIDADEGWLLATDDTKKRDLIKNAVAIQRNKGTKYAVKKALEVVGLTGTISEWFEYGGQPYWFKVGIDGTQNFTPEQLNLLDRYIIKNKNTRSWCLVVVSATQEDRFNVAAGLIESNTVTFYAPPASGNTVYITGANYYGANQIIAEDIVIKNMSNSSAH